MLYQKDSWVPRVGALKVWATDESPLVGEVPPTRAAYVPPCAPELATEVVPAVVQPVRAPDSKPPLETSAAGPASRMAPRASRAVLVAMASLRLRDAVRRVMCGT
jgi:hypothetical protein